MFSLYQMFVTHVTPILVDLNRFRFGSSWNLAVNYNFKFCAYWSRFRYITYILIALFEMDTYWLAVGHLEWIVVSLCLEPVKKARPEGDRYFR